MQSFGKMKNHETIPVGSAKQESFPSTWNLQIQARNADTTVAIEQLQGFGSGAQACWGKHSRLHPAGDVQRK